MPTNTPIPNPQSHNLSLHNNDHYKYWTSGLLDFMRVDSLTTHAILSISAVLGFLYFDSTIAGLLLAIATAVAGPLAEIVLINIPHLYVYTHADLWGICSWIPWVYFLGIIVTHTHSNPLSTQSLLPSINTLSPTLYQHTVSYPLSAINTLFLTRSHSLMGVFSRYDCNTVMATHTLSTYSFLPLSAINTPFLALNTSSYNASSQHCFYHLIPSTNTSSRYD